MMLGEFNVRLKATSVDEFLAAISREFYSLKADGRKDLKKNDLPIIEIIKMLGFLNW